MSTTTAEPTTELALNGGPKSVVTEPSPRRRWGAPERKQLDEMLGQGSLFYWNGPQTKLLVERFQQHYPLKYVMPCSSGTAAIHIAVAAAGIGPGDEVIMPPITDMGTAIGVLYQQGVPVFADLLPHSYNLDPKDVEANITSKTKAVIAVHLTGNPADLGALRALCDKHKLILIEDCAQAWGARYNDKPVGTIGDIGCWSLNDYKHISCGDGGMVASSDERFGPLLQKFGDKAYDRTGTGGQASAVLAPNYRISEPQSAIAAAQMDKMVELTGRRASVGRIINSEIEGLRGVAGAGAAATNRWTCWFYMFRVDEAELGCDRAAFAEALRAEGVPANGGYIASPIYRYPIFAEHNFFAGRWPVKELGLTDMDYTRVRCPVAEEILASCITIGVHEGHSDQWAHEVGRAIQKVANAKVRR